MATAGTIPCKKMNLYFTFECGNCVDLFSAPFGLKTCLGLTMHINHFLLGLARGLLKRPSFSNDDEDGGDDAL